MDRQNNGLTAAGGKPQVRWSDQTEPGLSNPLSAKDKAGGRIGGQPFGIQGERKDAPQGQIDLGQAAFDAGLFLRERRWVPVV